METVCEDEEENDTRIDGDKIRAQAFMHIISRSVFEIIHAPNTFKLSFSQFMTFNPSKHSQS